MKSNRKKAKPLYRQGEYKERPMKLFAIDPLSELPQKSKLKKWVDRKKEDLHLKEYQDELDKILALRTKATTLWDTEKYCKAETWFEQKYRNEIKYCDAQYLLDVPKGYQPPDSFEYKQLSEELKLINHEIELKSDDKIAEDRDKVEDRLFVLDKEKQKKDDDEKNCLTQQVLTDVDTIVDPTFQFIINIYAIAKHLIRGLTESADRTISYVSFSFGKILNFVNLFSIWRDTSISQRKTKIFTTIFNILAAIGNTTVTAVRTNPYAQTIIGLSTITLALYKDSYCTHQMRMGIQKEQEAIASLKNRLRELSEIKNRDTLKELEKNRLDIQIKYRTLALQDKIDNALFEQFRCVFFTTLNAVCGIFLLAGALAVGTTLFPAMWIPLLSTVATSCASIQLIATFFDLIDQFTHKLPYFNLKQYQFSKWLCALPFRLWDTLKVGLKNAWHGNEPAPVELENERPILSSSSIVATQLFNNSGKPIDFQSQPIPTSQAHSESTTAASLSLTPLPFINKSNEESSGYNLKAQ